MITMPPNAISLGGHPVQNTHANKENKNNGNEAIFQDDL